MGGPKELAPWTSLSGRANDDVTQPQREWVDAASHADGVFFVDLKDISGSPALHLQTSMTQDDADFETFVSTVSSTGHTILISRLATATTPIMRYLRWKVVASASDWNVSFRVLSTLKNR